MKRKLFCLMCFAALWATNCTSQPTNATGSLVPLGTNTFPFVEKSDLDAGTTRGYATLSVENPVIQTGKSLKMEVRFLNQGMGRDFLNPFFCPRDLYPGQIALYNGDHKYIGDLLKFHTDGSAILPWPEWISIPYGGSVGVEMQFRLDYFGKQLPPGDYYVQVIYFKAFAAVDWSNSDPDPKVRRPQVKEFISHFDSSELFRSNPVKITITK